jgi:PRD1 phage membrane DNA delivery
VDFDKLTGPIIAIVSGVIGLAIVAVIVSRNAQTPTVIGAAGSALSSIIGAAVSPVTGGSGGGGGGGIGPASYGGAAYGTNILPSVANAAVIGAIGASGTGGTGTGTGFVDSGTF